MCVCVCVCERERKREEGREGGRVRGRERARESILIDSTKNLLQKDHAVVCRVSVDSLHVAQEVVLVLRWSNAEMR